MNENLIRDTQEGQRLRSTEATEEVKLLQDKENLVKEGEKQKNLIKPRAIDIIINNLGYTNYHFILIFCCGLTYFSEGDILFSLNMLMPTINLIFSKKSEAWRTMLASSLFLGYVCGTFFTGYLTKTVGRRSSLNICMLSFTLLSISMGIIENIQFMTFCRYFIGMTMGIILPQYIANLSEYLPILHKEIVVMSMYIFYRAGIIYFIVCYTYISPNNDITKLRECFLIAALPVIIVTVLTQIFFRDSPKLLLSKNKLTLAAETLDDLQGRTGQDGHSETLNVLIEDLNLINRENIESKFVNIFSRDYVYLTILSSLIFLSTSMINVIFIYALPILLVKKHEINLKIGKHDNHNVAQQMLITQIVTIPSILLSAMICKLIGRKNTIAIGMISCFIASAIPAFLGQKLIICSTLVNFFVIFGQCTIKLYVIEAFPTRLRDYALAFCYFLSKLGDAFTPLFCNLSFKVYLYGPIAIANLLSLIGSISTLLLPFDTLGLHND